MFSLSITENDIAIANILKLQRKWFMYNVYCYGNGYKYDLENKQGKSEGFDSCDRPSNLTQIGLNLSIFQPVWPWNLMDDLQKP